MLCAISGEAPQVPVVSRKSGHLFEKRLIEAHIKEHHTDPVTGEDLEIEDLLELKSARILHPRPPTLTSIPALLSAFQNEWDAIALETYNLRKELSQTRQELSTTLYQHDAATRVIARLVKERDDARDALSKVTVSAGGSATNGDAMQIDSQAMPEELAAIVSSTQAELSRTRKKRPVSEDWATGDEIQALHSVQSTEPLHPGGRTIVLDTTGDLAIVGGSDGVAGVYSLSKQEVVQTLNADGQITAAAWWGSKAVIGTTNGSIKVFENGAEVSRLGSHAGAVTSLALHPSGNIFASSGIDKCVVFYDLSSLKVSSQIYTNAEITSGVFHPDGHLFGAGGQDGTIKLFDVASGSVGAEIKTEAAVQQLAFSENGYWLASASQGETEVSIWDLRKLDNPKPTKTLDVGSPVQDLTWDYTGQFIAVAGPGCVAVQQYSKSSKKWSEPFRKAVPAKGVRWGANAKELVTLTADDRINVFGIS